jgi:hypothetical protein
MGPRHVVFLLKNGISFGHHRRALLIADALRELDAGVDVTIVSQSSSGTVFRQGRHRVVNLPELDRLPSNAHVRGYLRLLEGIASGLRPGLVVEDTYPDRWYPNLLGLRNVPRVLILRRVDRLGLDEFHATGHLARFERIVVPHDADDFFEDGHSGVLRALAAGSGRFRFCGPVFEVPSAEDVDAVGRIRGGGSLVVASAGAGGDHFDDAFCDRFFATMAEVAGRFAAAGRAERFVLVLGPYFRGRRPPAACNLEVVAEEPRLPALLQRASVAVLRPGYNTLHEALSGPARVVVVPGVSWMEDQDAYVGRLVRRYDGVAAAALEDVDGMHAEVLAAADRGPVRSAPARVSSAHRDVASAILGCLEGPPRLEEPGIFLLARGGPIDGGPPLDHVDESGAVAGPDGTPTAAVRVWEDAAPPPERLVRDGVVVLLTPTWGPEKTAAARWLRSYEGGRAGILCHPLEYAGADQRLDVVVHGLARGLRATRTLAVLLDASTPGARRALPALVAGIRRWCGDSGVQLVAGAELVRRLVDAALDPSRGARWA